MSKASQRRQAAQRKRETEVRGSPEKRLRLLLEQDMRWEAPARFWKECIKHLPADPVTPRSESLRAVIERAKPLLDIAATNWTVQFAEAGDDPDEILPGVLMPFVIDPTYGARFSSSPFSLFGRAFSEDTDIKQVVMDAIPDEFDGALWVFGSVVTLRGETFVLALHRDGTLMASVRVAGQWIDLVPTFTASASAYITATFMVDERGTEALALMEAVGHSTEVWADLERRTALLRKATSDAQAPYLNAMWRLMLNQMANSTSDDLRDDLKAYAEMIMADRNASKKIGAGVDDLRAQLEASKARVKALEQDLQRASQRTLPAPLEASPVISISAVQRLSAIF